MKQRIRLTESQLHRVIRKCVNEALETDNSDNTGYYAATDLSFTLVEDSYKEGEFSDAERYWSSKEKFEGNTIRDLVSKIADKYGCELEDVYIYDDYVMMNSLTDENLSRLSNDEMNQWRNGKLKGYDLEIRFKVVKKFPLSHDELLTSGFDSYD